MKVQISRNESGLWIGVKIYDHNKEWIWFNNNDSPNAIWDEVMKDTLRKELNDYLEHNRETLYNMGWKDAKSKKRKKKTGFSGCFNSNPEYCAWEE